MTIAISGTSGITQTGSFDSSSTFGFKNRLINSAMVIDQRNAGASVTQGTAVAYTVDRWSCYGSAASKFTVQRNAGSVTPPTGYINYLGVTSSSAYTVGASEFFFVQQVIEGFNIADLAFGTASAATVTLSFWVRSSLTGTFGGTLSNGATTRVYPFTYTISSANTWTQISVAVAGDTAGTWTTDNTGGLVVNFNMGAGATVSGTAGAWSGSTLRAPTGAVSVVGTLNATFYITGVQLEKGSTATSFDYRPYGTELQLCQRYFEMSYDIGTAPATATSVGFLANGGFLNGASANYAVRVGTQYKVTKRATPTVTTYDSAGASGKCNFPDTTSGTAMTVIANGMSGFTSETTTVTTTQTRCYWHYTSSAEL